MKTKTGKNIFAAGLSFVTAASLIFSGISTVTVSYAATVVSSPHVQKSEGIISATWDCVWFGSYPQAEVISSEMNKNYTSLVKPLIFEGDLVVDDETYQQLSSSPESSWNENGDITIGSEKYRRIKQEDASGSADNDGHYVWSDAVSYHYFKYEPIKWRVLYVDGNDGFLMADRALDGQDFHDVDTEYEEREGITWEQSTLRSWLNGYNGSFNAKNIDYSADGVKNFIDSAFSEEQKTAIIEKNTTENESTDTGNNTLDKVFLLSEDEIATDVAEQYGFYNFADAYDDARICWSSTYAKAMGILSDNVNSACYGRCGWMLRTPNVHKDSVIEVTEEGLLEKVGAYGISAVRPALHLDLSQTSLYSYAGTLDSDQIAKIKPAESGDAQGSAEGNNAGSGNSGNNSTEMNPPAVKTYSIKFDANGGKKLSQSTKEVKAGSPIGKLPSVGKKGYAFKGWYTSKRNGQRITEKTVCDQNMSFYAQWTKIKVVKPSSVKLAAGRNKLTVTYKKASKAAGYQIRYSTKSNMKSAKKQTVNGKKKVLRNLKGKRTYYVQVRAYRKDSLGKKVYSLWSKKAKMKTR